MPLILRADYFVNLLDQLTGQPTTHPIIALPPRRGLGPCHFFHMNLNFQLEPNVRRVAHHLAARAVPRLAGLEDHRPPLPPLCEHVVVHNGTRSDLRDALCIIARAH